MAHLEAVAWRCSVKKVFLKTSQKAEACNFIEKETLAQVFSSEFREISKNTYGTPPDNWFWMSPNWSLQLY